MSASLDDIRTQLESIAEQLADLAIAQLRQSIDDDDPDGVKAERRLTRARRAVEKAISLLDDRGSARDLDD